jgi:hypothetical protein
MPENVGRIGGIREINIIQKIFFVNKNSVSPHPRDRGLRWDERTKQATWSAFLAEMERQEGRAAGGSVIVRSLR